MNILAKKTFLKKILLTLDMIKFQHSLFAMPFALAGLFFATHGQPSFKLFILIVLAMITARNAAMSFNRIADRDIDVLNPRTQKRPLITGELSPKFAIAFCLFNSTLFVVIASFFNQLTFILSPVVLFILLGYSLTKRFTHLTQLFLGLSLGISPIAAWIASTGSLTLFPCLIGLGVFFWVAGFDLIYSCQDLDFDKKNSLKNMTVWLGISRALLVSKLFHFLSVSFFFLTGFLGDLSFIYFTGILFITGFLIYEHSLVKANDLSHINIAFFTMNGYVSLAFLLFSLLDIYL